MGIRRRTMSPRFFRVIALGFLICGVGFVVLFLTDVLFNDALGVSPSHSFTVWARLIEGVFFVGAGVGYLLVARRVAKEGRTP
ncbi:MAG: hypothetical protein M3N46_13480 [Actinomycetota bacterium]|nr:hypothetical protein [Actinomycetota bacterium]